ncbi:MAG TPA: putative Ig domain-containing protein [Holophagaceae bacterium]|nr:putative Ig domain-containing protein [Holophagaceae bacterium]
MNSTPLRARASFALAAMALGAVAGLLSCSGGSSNRAPRLSNATFDNGGVPFNGAKSFNVQTLTQASDPEGGALQFHLVRTGSVARLGDLTFTGVTATFTPRPGVEGNAVFEIVAVDPQGAVSWPARLTVAGLDTKAPQIEAATYDLTAPTSHDVTASLRVTEREDLPAPTGWAKAGVSPSWTYTRTYSANITGDPFTLVDAAGNGSTQLITIANIDRAAPMVADAAYSPSSTTNQDVIATFRSPEDLAAPAGWAKAFEPASGQFAFTRTYPVNTAETISFFDAAANRSDKVVNITWIDKTAPTVVTFATANLTSTSTDLVTVVDENAKGYLWFPATPPTPEPTIDDVVQHATADASILTLSGNQTTTTPKAGLTQDTPYVAYLVAEDPALNRSGVQKLNFRTPVTPDAPTTNPAPTGAPSGSELLITWGLSDADGVQFGKVELFAVPGGLLATNTNAVGASQVTFPNIPRGTYTALAYGKALNATTAQWQDVTSPSSMSIVVPNHAPTLPAGISLPAGTQGASLNMTLPAATDLDGDPLTYALSGTLPAGVTFTSGTRRLTGIPTQAGTFSLSYAASDGQGGSVSQTVPLVVNATTFLIKGNAGVGGATLAYVDGTAKTATADAGGTYSFPVSYGWSGTVTPGKAGYTFSPASSTYSNVLSNQAQDYLAAPILYSLSGNAGIGGATLSYVDGTAKTATADASGAYTFTVPLGWSGTVTPSKPGGYIFTPASRSYTSLAGNQTNQNYTIADLLLTGTADIQGNSLFTIKNTGGAMNSNFTWEIYQNGVFLTSGVFQLTAAGTPGDTQLLTINGLYGNVTVAIKDGTTASATQIASVTVLVEFHPPVTIKQATGQTDPSYTTPIRFSVTFDGPVTGFDASDVVITGMAGTPGVTVTGSGASYQVAVTGMVNGETVTATIPANVCVSTTSGFGNLASRTGYDNHITFAKIDLHLSGSADFAGNSSFLIKNDGAAMFTNYTWEIYQNGVFLTSGVFQLTAGGTAGDSQTLTINGLYGNVTVAIKDGTTASATQIDSVTVFVEYHPPVTIKQATGQADPTSASPILFSVVFDGPVTGFDASDVVITGMAGTPGITVTGSGATYQVAVTGMAHGETVTATIPANAALSTTSGFGNLASRTGYDNRVTFN